MSNIIFINIINTFTDLHLKYFLPLSKIFITCLFNDFFFFLISMHSRWLLLFWQNVICILIYQQLNVRLLIRISSPYYRTLCQLAL